MFLQIEDLWQSFVSQVYQHHFSNSICLVGISIPLLGNPQNISVFHYYYICHGDLWWVVWCYYCSCFEAQLTMPTWNCKQWINAVCILTTPPTAHSPKSLLVLKLFFYLTNSNIEARPINNHTISICVQVKEESHISHWK